MLFSDYLIDSWFHEIVEQRAVDRVGLLPPPTYIWNCSQHWQETDCDAIRWALTDVKFLGIILSFCLMTPFMMPSMVLESGWESWPRWDVEYFMACKLLIGDEPTGMSSATGSMPESSMKLYTSCQRKEKQVKKEKLLRSSRSKLC